MRFIIRRGTGITLSNICGDVFGLIQSFEPAPNGDLILMAESGVSEEIKRLLMGTNAAVPTRMTTYDQDIVLEQVPPIERAVQMPYGVVMEGVQTATPQPIGIPANTNVVQEARHMDQARRIVQVIDDDTNDNVEVDEDDVSGKMVASGLHAVQVCKEGSEQLLIARSMHNSMSSNANVILEKTLELNRLMARSIVLQNELTVLSKPLEGNAKIVSILEQVKAINDSGGFVKKAYINENGNISILTNHIYTEVLGEDIKPRDVGEMEIIIMSSIVFSESVNGTSLRNPIYIKNLTHYLANADSNWSCGHSHHEGEICFGRVFPQIHRALVDKNLMMAVELIIRFIRNPDPNDTWGKNILGFPIHVEVPAAVSQEVVS